MRQDKRMLNPHTSRMYCNVYTYILYIIRTHTHTHTHTHPHLNLASEIHESSVAVLAVVFYRLNIAFEPLYDRRDESE